MTTLRIITPSAGMFNKASAQSGRETDALFGECVDVLQHRDGDDGHQWADIILKTDGYQAWIRDDVLGRMHAPSHHVIAPRALMTIEPDIKSPSAGYLPMGSLIHSKAVEESRFMAVHGPELDNGDDPVIGYIMADHVLATGAYIDDYVTAAESLIGSPYRWGGRDSFGFDCSALVQLSMAAAGHAVPRNSSDQEKAIGTSLQHLDDLQRGDLVFWKGHVGIMQDEERLLHANMWHGMTASENLREALPRLDEAAGPITRLARP